MNFNLANKTSAKKHLYFFQFLIIRNNTALNAIVHISLFTCERISMEKTPKTGIYRLKSI